MTTYRQPASTEYDADSPFTATLAAAMVNNPIAIAEGSTGAPIVYAGWHPYDGVTVGDGADGEIWSFATDGAVSSIATPDFEDGFEYTVVFDATEISATANLTVELYRETSASYVNIETLSTLSASAPMYGAFHVPFARIANRQAGIVWIGGFFNTSLTKTHGDGASAVITAQKILRARLSLSTGNFDAGAVRMLRRREYFSG